MNPPQVQQISDDGDLRRYRTEIPNMADDDLDPYQYRLYAHYKRVCGAMNGTCYESVRTTAENTKMSVGKVVSTRDWLADEGWIDVTQTDVRVVVRIVDRWAENCARFAPAAQAAKREKKSVHQVNSTPESVHEVNADVIFMSPDVHHMNGSVHQVNGSVHVVNTKERTNKERTNEEGGDREYMREPAALPPSQQSTNSNGAAVVHKQGSPYMTGLLLPGGFVPAGTGANAVQVYYERFHYSDPDAHLTRPKEDDLIRLCPDLDRLREVVTEYSRTGYRAGNVKLILDWYRDGVPARQANTNGGTNGNAITGNGKNGNGNGWNAGGRNGADSRKPWADYKDPQWTAEEFEKYGALLAGRAQ